jgi:dihydroorotate dehydrogenase electron transfer subunit
MAEVNRGFDPLLKRAFSLFRRIPQGIQIMYRIHGKGTSNLRNMKESSAISMLGPLGNGYPLPEEGQTPVVIAGGIGIASLFSLIEKFAGRAYVIYGARTKEELFMLDELKHISKGLFVSTDDGTFGEKGNVIDLLNHQFPIHDSRLLNSLFYACGPKPMLREVSKIASERKIKAYLSLEEHMACGIGACLGCVVETKSQKYKYQRVCKEGPVFDAEDIIW